MDENAERESRTESTSHIGCGNCPHYDGNCCGSPQALVSDGERWQRLVALVEEAGDRGIVLGGVCYFSVSLLKGKKRIGEGITLADAVDDAFAALVGDPNEYLDHQLPELSNDE